MAPTFSTLARRRDESLLRPLPHRRRWFPALVLPACSLIAALMLGAILMHLRVRYPLMKSVPAGAVRALTAFILVATP